MKPRFNNLKKNKYIFKKKEKGKKENPLLHEFSSSSFEVFQFFPIWETTNSLKKKKKKKKN